MSRGHSILLVDDNPQILEFLQQRLRSLGYRTTIVTNGEAAIEHVRREAPSLVVLDVTMPELNGYQACREIKAIDRKIPVIILTAKVDSADRFWAKQAGADVFLNKPVDPAVVVERIGGLLANR
ncbi:MAG: response regulator [Labilithrix sp.]|nr:response regulator [Labilithrix sp.]